MLKIFAVSQANPDKPTQTTLDSKCFGVVVTMYLKNFLSMEEKVYSEYAMQQLKLNIKNIYLNYKKHVALRIPCGHFSGNIYNEEPKIPFIEMVRKHHIDQGDPVRIKMPVPFNRNFTEKLALFLTWFSRELYKDIVAWEAIDNVAVTGINDVSSELRMTAADFSNTGNTDQAHIHAAEKWLSVGYDTQAVRDAFAKIIYEWSISFPHKQLVLPIIAGLAGFPCISEKGEICYRNMRPDLTAQFITHGKNYENFCVQYTALDTTAKPPDKVIKSGVPIFYQAAAETFNNNQVSKADFEKMLLNGIDHKAVAIEVWEANVRNFPDIIEKYQWK